jgi:beta-lactamase superfamily II metal-dependent hydrolase
MSGYAKHRSYHFHFEIVAEAATRIQSLPAAIILISADSPNRFGFPHAAVIERYKAINATYYITGETGGH